MSVLVVQTPPSLSCQKERNRMMVCSPGVREKKRHKCAWKKVCLDSGLPLSAECRPATAFFRQLAKVACLSYSSSPMERGSFLYFGRRWSRLRLSTNFFEGRMGARSRGRSLSFLIVIFGSFFFISSNQSGWLLHDCHSRVSGFATNTESVSPCVS